MIEQLALRRPDLAITVRPIAHALGVDPDVYAALLMGMLITEDVAKQYKVATETLAASVATEEGGEVVDD